MISNKRFEYACSECSAAYAGKFLFLPTFFFQFKITCWRKIKVPNIESRQTRTSNTLLILFYILWFFMANWYDHAIVDFYSLINICWDFMFVHSTVRMVSVSFEQQPGISFKYSKKTPAKRVFLCSIFSEYLCDVIAMHTSSTRPSLLGDKFSLKRSFWLKFLWFKS